MNARRYAALDIDSAPKLETWPAAIPPLTGPEAARAARRLYRFAMGRTFGGDVQVTSGRRYNWLRRGTLVVNPDRGWRHLVHDLSHLFVYLCNPGERPHSRFHERFEAKLVREVLRRGYLDGKLRDKPKAGTARAKPALDDKRRAKLDRIEARMVSWERKHARAARAIAKLERQRRYYAKALGALDRLAP